ncbi:hypothetical protein JMJ56_33035 [Belnapia sp. T18]|uniref:Uncharacterized protein n=1 Tax=Belnapia arida TaxID=2804533 RepID=A0ABS1UDM7_9PROT|nr:hypothetical protein [Belnapia arida]MBL6082778.1 hypothetical protein [Belnapia arida]
MNNKGQVAGTLSPFARVSSGFVYDDGEVTTVGPPQPDNRPTSWTIEGINDAGALVGNYDDLIYSAPGETEGNFAFLATPKAAAPPKHEHSALKWDALAARLEANFAATGKWFVPDDISIPVLTHPIVD